MRPWTRFMRAPEVYGGGTATDNRLGGSANPAPV